MGFLESVRAGLWLLKTWRVSSCKKLSASVRPSCLCVLHTVAVSQFLVIIGTLTILIVPQNDGVSIMES